MCSLLKRIEAGDLNMPISLVISTQGSLEFMIMKSRRLTCQFELLTMIETIYLNTLISFIISAQGSLELITMIEARD